MSTDALLEQIGQLTLVEAAELVKKMEEKFGISTAAPVAVAAGGAPAAGGGAGADAEDAEFYETNNALKEISNPENITLSKELKQAVFNAIEALPEDLKTAMTLRELEGLSYEEIAEVMDCPVGTVRSRIFRAREAVEKRIKPLL